MDKTGAAARLMDYMLKHNGEPNYRTTDRETRELLTALDEDNELQTQLRIIAEGMRFKLIKTNTGNHWLMMPTRDNTLFGYTLSEVKRQLVPGTGEQEAKQQLSLLAIAVFLSEIYSDGNNGVQNSNFRTIEIWDELLGQAVSEGAKAESEDDTSGLADGYNFKDMQQTYEAMLPLGESEKNNENSNGRKVETKDGFFERIINFLAKNKLVVRLENQIHTTDRLDSIMTIMLSDHEKLQQIRRLMNKAMER